MTAATVPSKTVRDPDSPVAPPGARCVRCGRLEPAPWLFICARCEQDPDTFREIRNVEEGFLSYERQRKVLVMFGWAGGWWR